MLNTEPGFVAQDHARDLVAKAGACPRCGKEPAPSDAQCTHDREWDEDYYSVQCSTCGNSWEPRFGWHSD